MSQLVLAAGHASDSAEDDAPQPNQLALVAADAPLLPPSARLLNRRLKAGTTRRQGCGVCRSCLFFPNRKACLATKTVAQLDAQAEVKQRTAAKRQHAKTRERQLDKQSGSGAPSLGSSLLPQQSCRLCKCADHTAAACPLQMRLGSSAPAEATWADALDPHLRAVLLSVQQLASARLYARCRSGKLERGQFSALTPADLRRVEAALCTLRDGKC